MSALYLTIAGVVVAALTATYSTVIDNTKTVPQRSILVIIAAIGLGLGIWGAVSQDAESAKSQKALTHLQANVGSLNEIDQKINARSEDLTKLDLLGGSNYYIVIGTYPSSPAGNADYERVLADVKTFFPDADRNGMVWKHPKPRGQYEMGFGRHLSPVAAQLYLGLADYLAKEQHPMMRLER